MFACVRTCQADTDMSVSAWQTLTYPDKFDLPCLSLLNIFLLCLLNIQHYSFTYTIPTTRTAWISYCIRRLLKRQLFSKAWGRKDNYLTKLMTTNLVLYYNMESRIKHARNKNLMGYVGLTRQIILSVMTPKVARFVWLSA